MGLLRYPAVMESQHKPFRYPVRLSPKHNGSKLPIKPASIKGLEELQKRLRKLQLDEQIGSFRLAADTAAHIKAGEIPVYFESDEDALYAKTAV